MLKRILSILIIIILLFSNITNVNAYTKTTVDLTGLITGTDTTHTCIYESKYNETHHWQECFLCPKKISVSLHTKITTGRYDCNTPAYGHRYEVCTEQSCGYNIILPDKPHTSTQTWATDVLNYRHSKHCTTCGHWTASGYCKDANGNQLGCGRTGTCVECGYTYTDTSHGQITGDVCEICRKKLINLNISTTILGQGETRVLFELTPVVSGLVINIGDAFSSCSGFGNNGEFKNKSWWQSNGKYYLQADLKLNELINPNGVEFHWYGTYSYNGNTKGCHLSTAVKPDNYAPYLYSINVTGNGTVDNFSRSAEITATFMDTWDSVNNILYMRLLDKNGGVLSNWKASTKNGLSYTTIFDVVAEIREPETVTIEVKDISGNISKTTTNLQYIDTKAPQVISYSQNTNYTKTKDITFLVQDKGSGDVSIAFNNQSDFQKADIINGNYSREYTFTGDVYGTVKGAIYTKDKLGNISTTKVEISNLDNTAPNITNTNVSYVPGRANITVTADDIKVFSATYKASGSGVAGYAITNTNEAPNSYQTSNVLTVTKNATYYIWVKDAVGNVTSKQITISGITCDITPNANLGGVISTKSKVEYNESTSIFIIPMKGYEIENVIVNGVSVGKVNTYNFFNVKQDYTIIANFVKTQNWKNELEKMKIKYDWINIK